MDALGLIQDAIESLEGTAEEKLAAIEEAIKSQTTSLTTKLEAIEAAMEDGIDAIDLVKDAIASLEGTAEEKLAALEEAVKSQTTSLSTKLEAIEDSIDYGVSTVEDCLDLITDAIESLEGTTEEKLAAIEEAIKDQTTSLKTKLEAIEAAVKNGFADSAAALDLIKDALLSINNSVDGLEDLINDIVEALEDLPDYEEALDAICDAIAEVTDAVNGLQIPDYTSLLVAIKNAIDNISIGGGETPIPAMINGHEYVDMGNGLKWAKMNVGATRTEDNGSFFAWGATETCEDYLWANYPYVEKTGYADLISGYMSIIQGFVDNVEEWALKFRLNKYTFDDSHKTWASLVPITTNWYLKSGSIFNPKYTFNGDNLTTLEADDDAANAAFGSTWRTPTAEEWAALMNPDDYSWRWESNYNGSGVAGMVVTCLIEGDCEGNFIFLPAAGMNPGLDDSMSVEGYYWSADLGSENSWDGSYASFDSSGASSGAMERCKGLSIRPVSD